MAFTGRSCFVQAAGGLARSTGGAVRGTTNCRAISKHTIKEDATAMFGLVEEQQC
jgi:hypothetical protein